MPTSKCSSPASPISVGSPVYPASLVLSPLSFLPLPLFSLLKFLGHCLCPYSISRQTQDRGAGPHGLPNAHVEEGSLLRSRSQNADTLGAEKGDQEGSHGEWPVVLARPSGDSFSDIHLGTQDSLNCIPGHAVQGTRLPASTRDFKGTRG